VPFLFRKKISSLQLVWNIPRFAPSSIRTGAIRSIHRHDAPCRQLPQIIAWARGRPDRTLRVFAFQRWQTKAGVTSRQGTSDLPCRTLRAQESPAPADATKDTLDMISKSSAWRQKRVQSRGRWPSESKTFTHCAPCNRSNRFWERTRTDPAKKAPCHQQGPQQRRVAPGPRPRCRKALWPQPTQSKRPFANTGTRLKPRLWPKLGQEPRPDPRRKSPEVQPQDRPVRVGPAPKDAAQRIAGRNLHARRKNESKGPMAPSAAPAVLKRRKLKISPAPAPPADGPAAAPSTTTWRTSPDITAPGPAACAHTHRRQNEYGFDTIGRQRIVATMHHRRGR